MLKLNELLTVGEWYEKSLSGITGYTALEHAFKQGTSIAEGTTTHELFSEIYIPVKLATSSGEPETITWKNVGLLEKDIAGYYDDLYHSCRIAVKYHPFDGFYVNSYLTLVRKISRVVNINLRKYLKMLELDGFYYNPLWNVAGVETFATAEHEGTRTDFGMNQLGKTVSATGAISDGTDVKTTHNVSAYDSGVKEEFNDTSQGTTADWRSQVNNGLSIQVVSGDDPFGNGLTDEMRYHIEKRIRQGNIGVTKTQELIESERENLRFNIIEEFFKDLNKSILVGIYD